MQERSSNTVKVFYPKLSREEAVSKIKQLLPQLNTKLPLQLVVLFGSYAENRHTASSDIDLIIVYSNPPRRDAYKTVVKTLQLPRLEPILYSEEEFQTVKKTNPRFIETILKKGIALQGNLSSETI
jgi:predicted nucleotidyltransferase